MSADTVTLHSAGTASRAVVDVDGGVGRRALPRAFEKRQSSDHADDAEPVVAEVQEIRDEVLDQILSCKAVVAAA